MLGSSKPEILRYMRANRVKPDLIAVAREVKSDTGALRIRLDAHGDRMYLLWLSGWIGDPDDLDTLVHETNHLVYDIARDKGFQNEPEILAYQQGYLVSGILRLQTCQVTELNLRVRRGR